MNALEPILRNVSFKIKSGFSYAFVGENGVGKTTILKLVLGLYEPMEGQIKINGKPISEYRYGQIKGIFSVVFQDYSKYDLKVYDFISLGNSELEEEKIMKSFQFVGLEDFDSTDLKTILNKELGKLSESSIELSEGQWQRLSIARALLNNKVLILDEATSSIDPIQERKLNGLLEKAMYNRTTILITHRLGMTKFVDCIFVLHKGEIIESGNHESLTKKGGVYMEMYNTQKRWYE